MMIYRMKFEAFFLDDDFLRIVGNPQKKNTATFHSTFLIKDIFFDCFAVEHKKRRRVRIINHDDDEKRRRKFNRATTFTSPRESFLNRVKKKGGGKD